MLGYTPAFEESGAGPEQRPPTTNKANDAEGAGGTQALWTRLRTKRTNLAVNLRGENRGLFSETKSWRGL